MTFVKQIYTSQRSAGPAAILAIATANPPNFVYQTDYPDYYFRVTKSDHMVELKDKFKRMCEKSTIRKRHFHLTEDILGKNPSICTPNGLSFDVRQEIAIEEVPKLGVVAASKAIQEWGQPKSKITHLIFCTSAGVDLPGADFRLAKLLQLELTVNRLVIYNQGCHAGGTALRLAKDMAENNRGARVLVVCSEIWVTGFRGPSDDLIGNMPLQVITADGAAALVVGADPVPTVERPLFYLASASQVTLPNSGAALVSPLRQEGFVTNIDKSVPDLLSNNIEKALTKAFSPIGINDWNRLFWVCHPGFTAVMNGLKNKLGLNDDKLLCSRHVLKEYGNMLSATVLFILDEMRKRSIENGKSTTGDGFHWGVLFGFGPGMTIETIVLHSVPTVPSLNSSL